MCLSLKVSAKGTLRTKQAELILFSGSPPQLGATLDNPAELSANADGAHYSNGKK